MNTLKRQWDQHPNIISFAILAIGMLIILYFSARHVGFTSTQWLALAAATLLLAGLCVWIIGWDAGGPVDDQADEPAAQPLPENTSEITGA